MTKNGFIINYFCIFVNWITCSSFGPYLRLRQTTISKSAFFPFGKKNINNCICCLCVKIEWLWMQSAYVSSHVYHDAVNVQRSSAWGLRLSRPCGPVSSDRVIQTIERRGTALIVSLQSHFPSHRCLCGRLKWINVLCHRLRWCYMTIW